MSRIEKQPTATEFFPTIDPHSLEIRRGDEQIGLINLHDGAVTV